MHLTFGDAKLLHSQGKENGGPPNPYLPAFVMLPSIPPQCPLDNPEVIFTISSGKRETREA